MKVINIIKNLYKYLIRGNKATSKSYEKYLRKIGVKIGEGCWFHDPATTYVDNDKPYMIEIGNNVQITRNCTIVAHGYDWIVLKNKYGGEYGSAGKIVIGNNVFLGMGTTILKNVEIGDNVIIGAGSIVTKDIESNCVAVGCPAKKIMTLDEYKVKIENGLLDEAVQVFSCLDEKQQRLYKGEFAWIYDTNNSYHKFGNREDLIEYIEEKKNETKNKYL